MATRPGDITANMGVQMNTGAMNTTLQGLQRQIDGIIGQLNKAAEAAEKAVNRSGKAGEAALKKAQDQAAQAARQIGKTMGNFENVRGANARGVLGGFQQDQKIGKMAEQMGKFQLALEGGGTAASNLNRRIAEGTQEFAKMARAGQTATTQQVRQQGALRETLNRYEAVNRQQRGIFENYGRLSADSQKALDPLFGKLHNLNNELGRLTNRGNRFSFNTNLGEQERVTAEIRRQIGELRLQDQQNSKLTQQVRERAREIANATEQERRLQLQAGANRYANLAGAGGNNASINGILGSPVAFRGNTDLMERFNTATRLATINRIQLNNALNSGVGSDRLQTLIDRQERLNRLQQQSLGLQAAQNNAPTARTGGFIGGMRSAAGNLLGGGDDGGMFGAGALVGRVASYAVAATAIYGVINAVKDGAKFAIEFEDSLAQLAAISGATGGEMQALSQNILDVSKNSANSVLEITKSATVLAQAGYSANETSLLLQNVVNLAAASGATTDQAVDILTSTLGAFQLQATEATHVTDALVAVLNESKLAVNQVQLGLQYVGATARESNITFETLVASLGAMADAGVRSGSTMSTGLRQLLVDLRDPSEKLVTQLKNIGLSLGDVDVQTRGLIPVLQTLRDHGFEAYGTLETRASAAYLVLSSNIPNIERLQRATLEQGTASEAAAKRLDSLASQWQIFKNVLSDVGNDLGQELIPLMKDLVGIFVEMAQGLVEVNDLFNDFRDSIPNKTIWEYLGLTKDSALASRDLSAALDEQVTRLNDATAATKSQEEQVTSIETEISSLLVRYKDLAKDNNATAYEVDRLSQRFPGLRSEFQQTQGGIEGLIGSLFRLRGELVETLKTKQQTEMTLATSTQRTAFADLRAYGGQLSATYDRTGENSLPAVRRLYERTSPIVKGLRSTDAATYENAQKAFREFLADDSFTERERRNFEKMVLEYISKKADVLKRGGEIRDLNRQIQATEFVDTDPGRNLYERTVRGGAAAQAAVSGVNGKPLGERQSTLAAALATAEREVTRTTLLIEELGKRGMEGAATAARSLLIQQQQTVNSLRTASKPTDDETRAANKGPDRAGAGRAPTAAEVAAELRRAFPGIGISFARQRRPGDVAYNPGSLHAKPGGNAIDITRLPSGVTTDNIMAVIESMGAKIAPGNNGFLDEFKHPSRNATGGHYHFGWQAKQSQHATDTERAEREAERDREEAIRERIRIIKQQVDTEKGQVDLALQELEEENDLTKITKRSGDLQQEFKEYAITRMMLAKEEAQKITDPTAAEAYLEQERTQIKTEWRQIVKKAADRITGAMSDMLDDSAKEAERVFNAATEETRLRLSRLQNQMTGLNDPLNSGRIPEYTRVLQQRRIDQANAASRNATFSANAGRIGSLMNDRDAAMAAYNSITQPEIKAAAFEEYDEKIKEITESIRILKEEQNGILAQYDALSLAPQGWNDAITQAVEAFRIQNNIGIGLGQRMRNDLGGALDAVHQGFQGFFSDIVSGTVSVSDAFGNMAKSVMSALADMAAKAIATQIFGLLLSFIPGASISKSGATAGTGLAKGFYQGGLVKKFATGGLVSAGIPTRDTVPAILSKGEFVMRRSSVEDVGHRLLQDINNRGASALNNLRNTTVVNPTPPPVETSVYVMLPEEKPQLGPNDVIAIVNRDVLNGGTTKALIKQVSRGG